jgi:hypothetical protein
MKDGMEGLLERLNDIRMTPEERALAKASMVQGERIAEFLVSAWAALTRSARLQPRAGKLREAA